MILIIILIVLVLIWRNLRKPAYIRKQEKKEAREEAFDTLNAAFDKVADKFKGVK